MSLGTRTYSYNQGNEIAEKEAKEDTTFEMQLLISNEIKNQKKKA
jgi:hypothetical protein